jgi:hypothetical protein
MVFDAEAVAPLLIGHQKQDVGSCIVHPLIMHHLSIAVKSETVPVLRLYIRSQVRCF